MIHLIYTIYDSKAQTYTLPFYMTTDAMAKRQFSNWANDPNHTFGKNPEDYTLFAAGQYDDETGTITQDHISSIGIALQFLKNEDSE